MPRSDLKSSNFAGPTLSVSDEKKTELGLRSKSKPAAMSASAAMLLDNQYTKANTKEEVKFIKLNFDNYQNWSDGMELLLDAKTL